MSDQCRQRYLDLKNQTKPEDLLKVFTELGYHLSGTDPKFYKDTTGSRLFFSLSVLSIIFHCRLSRSCVDKIHILHNDHQLTFDANFAVVIGRSLKCHFKIVNVTISSFHLILVPCPTLKILLVVDPGSLAGTICHLYSFLYSNVSMCKIIGCFTVKRSGGSDLVHSTTNHRRILKFVWGEDFVLQLSSAEKPVTIWTS